MTNELIFFIQIFVSLTLVLCACRAGYVALVGLISAVVVMMNLFVVKQINLFGLDVTAGNVLYASIFLSTDIISEHYGKRKAHLAVMVGFGVSLFFVFTSQIVLAYEPLEWDFAHGPMSTLYGLTPRIVLASMVAYLLSQNLDIRLFERFGRLTRGRFLWLRNNASTAISQLIDSILFNVIAFWGVMPSLWQIVLFTYIIKLVVAAVDTPFIYLTTLPWLRPPGSVRHSWEVQETSALTPESSGPMEQ